MLQTGNEGWPVKAQDLAVEVADEELEPELEEASVTQQGNEGRPVVVGAAISLIVMLFFGLSLGAVFMVSMIGGRPKVDLSALQTRARSSTLIPAPDLTLLAGITSRPTITPLPATHTAKPTTSIPTPSEMATAVLEIA